MEEFKESPKIDAGLCTRCRHRKENRSDRGAVFVFCLRSQIDPRFPKYPRLPKLECEGYDPSEPGPA